MSPFWIAVAVAAVVYVVVSRLAGEPLRAKRLVLLPLVMTVWGATKLYPALQGVSALDVTFLAVEGGLAVVAGLARGTTIQLFARDGHLWYRYRPLTVAVWIALAVVRVGLGVAGHALVVHSAVLNGALLLMFGLSLLGEAAVVGWRAFASGTPFAPDRRDRRTARVGLGTERG
jgi:hypothetical protein